jgi:hypothetical protein
MEKLEAYCAPKDTGAMYLEFDSMRQETNESLQDYVMRLKTAGALAGIVSKNDEQGSFATNSH